MHSLVCVHSAAELGHWFLGSCKVRPTFVLGPLSQANLTGYLLPSFRSPQGRPCAEMTTLFDTPFFSIDFPLITFLRQSRSVVTPLSYLC